MDEETHKARSQSFGAAADLYDRIRPGYPSEAARWMLGEPADAGALTVVDLGAGTGIFTRVLAALGARVIAVEPDGGMRDKLAANTPAVATGQVSLAEGSAEHIPLENGSVDVVVAAQAYHWFDQDKAHPEIARVLKVGGIWSPVWNMRDEGVDWVAELSKVGGMEDGRDSRNSIFEENIDDFGPLFDHPEVNEFHHSVSHDAESLVALIRSRSYWLTASPEGKEAMEAGVRAITATLPVEFDLPYTTIAYRCRKV